MLFKDFILKNRDDNDGLTDTEEQQDGTDLKNDGYTKYFTSLQSLKTSQIILSFTSFKSSWILFILGIKSFGISIIIRSISSL